MLFGLQRVGFKGKCQRLLTAFRIRQNSHCQADSWYSYFYFPLLFCFLSASLGPCSLVASFFFTLAAFLLFFLHKTVRTGDDTASTVSLHLRDWKNKCHVSLEDCLPQRGGGNARKWSGSRMCSSHRAEKLRRAAGEGGHLINLVDANLMLVFRFAA